MPQTTDFDLILLKLVDSTVRLYCWMKCVGPRHKNKPSKQMILAL